MEKKNTPQPRAKRAAPAPGPSQAYRNEAVWSVQQYKLSFELVFRGRPYAKGHKHDLEPIAAKLNELAALKAAPRVLTEFEARELAKHDRHYVARQNGAGEWIVWDCVSDHRVEFQD